MHSIFTHGHCRCPLKYLELKISRISISIMLSQSGLEFTWAKSIPPLGQLTHVR